MRLRDKLSALADLGVDYVVRIKFNRAFASLSAEQFIQEYLVQRLKVKFLSIGDDFRFGAGRQGILPYCNKRAKNMALQWKIIAVFS